MQDETQMKPQMRPIGLAHFSAIGLTPVELVSAAAVAGFDAVGLRLFPAFPGAPFYEVRQGSDTARALRQRLDQTGLKVFDIEFVVLDADFQPRAVLPVLEDAAALGAARLSVCGQDIDRARLTDNFAALCAVAAEVGMAVDLENMGWRPVRRVADSRAVVQASGAANAGVLVDALHCFRNGGDVAQIAALPPGMLRHAQLCDVRGPAPTTDETRIHEARESRFAPGAGELPLTGMVAALPPQTRISVEVPLAAGQDPAAHLASLRQGVREVMAQV